MRRLLGFLVLGVSFQAHAIGLGALYEEALRHDPAYRSAENAYAAGLENEAIGRSAMLPKMNASYSKSQNRSTQWGQAYSGGPNVANTWQYPSDYSGVFVTQPLFSLEAIARWKQGSAQAEEARARFVNESQELLLRVVTAYFEVLSAQSGLALAAATEKSASEDARVRRRLFEKGEGSQSDALQAESDAHIAQARFLEAQSVLRINLARLSQITGVEEGRLVKLSAVNARFKAKPVAASLSELVSAAIDSNPMLKALSATAEEARQEQRKAESGHYPTVNLVGGVTTQNSNTVTSINQTTNQNYVGIQVNLPLFSGGETAARSRQGGFAYEKALADRDVERDKVTQDVRRQFETLVVASQKVPALERGVRAADEMISAANKAIRSGEKIESDRLQADRQRAQARRDLIEAQCAYLLASLKLKGLAGRLEVSDLIEMTRFFNASDIQ